MNFTITSQTTQTADFSDGAKPFQDGCIGDKYTAVSSFYFQKGSTAPLILSLVGGVLTVQGQGGTAPTENFINDNFQVGEIIRLPGSTANKTVSLTIAALTTTSMVVSGSGMVNEDISNSWIWVTSKITNLDFLFNLLPGTNPKFNSLTDSCPQKFLAQGLDASVTTPVTFVVGTKSQGWVTGTATIAGTGISGGTNSANDYQQGFTITQTYFITPLFTAAQLRNFILQQDPGQYPLSYALGLNGYYSGATVPVATYQGILPGATSCWFNENSSGTVPEFTFGAIAYTDSNLLPLTAVDFSKTNLVTITINSASGLFANGVKVVLNHLWLPTNQTAYQNTATNLRQNFMNDRCVLTIGASAISGEFSGTNYSIWQTVSAVATSAYICTITCSAIYAATLQAVLKSANRNYAISVTTETASSTYNNRTAVLCDVNTMGYDQQDSTLLTFKDYAHFYKYPYAWGNGTNDCAGYVGDPFVVKIPFRVQNAANGGVIPKLNKVSVSIRAIKYGKQDLILESKIFNTGGACTLNGVQQINQSGKKGYITFANDPFNTVSLTTDGLVGTFAQYTMQYPFILRYDYWNPVNNSIGGQVCGDINNDLQNVNSDWSNLQGNGWALVLRFNADVQGYDGFVTTFQNDFPIRAISLNTAPDTALNFTCQLQYFNSAGAEITSPLKGEVTRIRATYTPNGFSPEGLGSYFGMVFIDLPGKGNPFTKRFASSELPSEAGSPFSATPPFPYLASNMKQWAYGGVRCGWFSRNSNGVNLFGTVILETNYDDSAINWDKPPVPYFRLEFKPDIDVLSDEQNRILTDEKGTILTP